MKKDIKQALKKQKRHDVDRTGRCHVGICCCRHSCDGDFIADTESVHESKDLAEANSLLDSLSSEIIGELTEANGVQVSGDTITINKTGLVNAEYTIKSGYLVFDKLFYKGKTISLNIDNSGLSTVVIKITVISSDDEDMVSREYAVKPLGLTKYCIDN